MGGGLKGVCKDSPVGFAAALLLGAAGVVAVVARLAKVAWEMLLWSGGSVGQANVVAVSGLVSTSH